MVDKHTRKICCSTNDPVVKALTFMGILSQQIIKSSGIFVWYILLFIPEDCMTVVNKELITKNLILRTEYKGMRKTSIGVYEFPSIVKREALAVYLKHYDQIIDISDLKYREWCLNIMLTMQAYSSDPNSLAVGERILRIMVTGRITTYGSVAKLVIWPLAAQRRRPLTFSSTQPTYSQTSVSSSATHAARTIVVKPSLSSMLGPVFPNTSLSNKRKGE